MVGDLELRRALCERGAVGLAVAQADIGVGRADDHVRGVGVLRDDLGERIDHQLVALAGPEQAEAQDHVPTRHADTGLDRLGGQDRQVRDAVRHDLDDRRIGAVGGLEQGGRRLGHDDRLPRRLDELDQDLALALRGIVRERVQRHRGGNAQRPCEVEDGFAVRAAPDALGPLDRRDVRAALEGSRGPRVVLRHVAPDAVVHLERVRPDGLGGMEGHDLAIRARPGSGHR